MKFYKATKDYTVYRSYSTSVNFIQRELITQKELNNLIHLETQQTLIDYGVLIEIEHSKQSTYWSFGARFQLDADKRNNDILVKEQLKEWPTKAEELNAWIIY